MEVTANLKIEDFLWWVGEKVGRTVFVSMCVSMFAQDFSTLKRKPLDRLSLGRYLSTRRSGKKTMVLIAERSGPTDAWHVQPRELLHDFIFRRYTSPILRRCVNALIADG